MASQLQSIASKDKAIVPRNHHRELLQQVTLVPLTTRLHPETAAALKRSYLERKLAGQLPNTQQEIIEEAVRDWLIAEGYLTS